MPGWSIPSPWASPIRPTSTRTSGPRCRARLQAEWNAPVRWPLYLVLFAVVALTRAGGADLLPGAPVMAAYLVRRIGYGLVTVFGVLFLLFVLFFAVTDPDDIARKAVGERARPEVYAQWKKNHGYDKPLFLNTQASDAKPLHRHAAVRALSPHAHLRFRPQRRRRQPDLRPPAGRGGPEPQPDGAAVRARPRGERGGGAVRRLLPRDLRRPSDARRVHADDERRQPALHHRRPIPGRPAAQLVSDLGLRSQSRR